MSTPLPYSLDWRLGWPPIKDQACPQQRCKGFEEMSGKEKHGMLPVSEGLLALCICERTQRGCCANVPVLSLWDLFAEGICPVLLCHISPSGTSWDAFESSEPLNLCFPSIWLHGLELALQFISSLIWDSTLRFSHGESGGSCEKHYVPRAKYTCWPPPLLVFPGELSLWCSCSSHYKKIHCLGVTSVVIPHSHMWFLKLWNILILILCVWYNVSKRPTCRIVYPCQGAILVFKALRGKGGGEEFRIMSPPLLVLWFWGLNSC